MSRTVINFIAFQVGWFSCVLTAASGSPIYGMLAVVLVLVLHLKLTVHLREEVTLIAFALALGLVFDSLILSTGWIRYPNGMLIEGFAPYWLLGIWAIFATTLNTSMSWLKDRLLLAALMGGIFGPLSYSAGARLGGLEFIEFLPAIVLLGVAWAVAMPLLITAAMRLDGSRGRMDASVLQLVRLKS